jgi:integration host factor subunit alpha
LTSCVFCDQKLQKVEYHKGGKELTAGVERERTTTLTRKELAEAVYAAVSLPRSEAAAFVEEVIGEISDALVRDGEVKFTNFGTFKVSSKPERVGRNPKSGDAAIITSRRVITFKAASGLKRKINGGGDEAAD